jgi:DNA mismatch repair protein MutS
LKRRGANCVRTSRPLRWPASAPTGCDRAIAAAGALLRYARATQTRALPHLRALIVERDATFLGLDMATRRNLELTETLRGQAAPTLYSLLDNCITSMGSRLLRHALHHPLRDPAIPAARHAAVAMLLDDGGRTLRDLRQAMRGFADIERIAGRIALYSARPRDLSSLRDSLQRLPELRTLLATAAAVPITRRTQRTTGYPGRRARPAEPCHPAGTGGADP